MSYDQPDYRLPAVDVCAIREPLPSLPEQVYRASARPARRALPRRFAQAHRWLRLREDLAYVTRQT